MIKVEKGKYSTLIKVFWIAFLAAVGSLGLYVFAVSTNLFGLFGPMPDLKSLENPKNDLSSEVYSADGVLLGKYFTENRTPIELEEVSPNLVNALLAAEDVRFSKHSGIDFKGTLAVPYYMVKRAFGGGLLRGSSTLSQQLAKILFETRDDDYEGPLGKIPGLGKVIIKSKEWILAINIERNYTKKEIMEMYLNTAEFGNNAYGIGTAAKTFFKKRPGELNVEESAMLVGLVNNPTFFDPVRRPNNALTRRNVVLAQMMKYGYITEVQFDTLKSKPIDLSRYEVENHNRGLATYFRANIKSFVYQWAKKKGYNLETDGLKIHTTLDSRMQRYAEQAVNEHMKKQQALFFDHWKGRKPWTDQNFREIPNYIENIARRTERYKGAKARHGDDEKSIWAELNTPVKMRVFTYAGERDTTMSPMDSIRYYKHFLHTGLMSMDPATGHVKAWVGGIDFKHFKYDHVRQGRRQPGSSFKPILYAAAIDNGYTPCFEVVDAPVTFTLASGDTWTPNNSDGPPSGDKITLRQAMGRSVNTISAYLIKRLGPETVVDYAKRLGINSPLEAVPSLSLGVSPVSLYEMLGVYSTFVNSGVWTEPMFITHIEDKNGNVIETFAPKTVDVLSEETAYLMVHMLQGALQESDGTARGLFRYKAAQNNEIGGKTGTTQNHADGWFMGITPNLVTGVWVGGDDMSIRFRSMTYGQGSRLALPAWGLYMDKIYADANLDYQKSKFIKPARLSVSLNCEDYHRAIMVSDSLSNDQYVAPKADDSLLDDGLLN
jgi:penicillin-binding protein 1A